VVASMRYAWQLIALVGKIVSMVIGGLWYNGGFWSSVMTVGLIMLQDEDVCTGIGMCENKSLSDDFNRRLA
jgi:hypothetical protein